MKKGDTYTFPRPNLYSVRELHEEFIESLRKEIKPAGLVISQSGSSPKWNDGKMDIWNLKDALREMTFTVTIMRYEQ